MRRFCLLLAALMILGACATTSGDNPRERTVLIDYQHDEFATAMLLYYPRHIKVHPGDTVVFKQSWSGEPHSVTMGKRVDALMEITDPYLQRFAKGEAVPDEPPAEVMAAAEGMPWMMDDDGVAQNGAQPCYLREGLPPEDSKTACTLKDQQQPTFDGTHNYYNSGFIPYEGQNGNTFEVKLAESIKPGRYWYYCNLHGEFMSGSIEVVDKSKPIPSQAEVNAQARKEIDASIKDLKAEWKKATTGKLTVPDEAKGLLKPGQRYFSGNLAGLAVDDEFSHGIINEFIPKQITVKAGEKVTWTMLGDHTISFNVPAYFPIIQVKKDRSVGFNPKLEPAAGGAPQPPDDASSFDEGATPTPTVIDAGPYAGNNFYSSGLFGGDPYAQWSVTITRKGTYKYACLIHPPMIGTLKVV